MQAWSGPLPSPDDLERFNKAHPDASAMILGEFQKQGEHRRALEGRVVGGNIRSATLGQVFTFIILGGLGAGGILLAYNGRDLVGHGTIVAVIASGLWAVHAARKAKKESLAEK